MSDNWQWTCYEAKLKDKAWRDDVDAEIKVHVFGMTEEIAREKLLDQYPASKYELKQFKFHYVADPLSDPNSHKGANGLNDN